MNELHRKIIEEVEKMNIEIVVTTLNDLKTVAGQLYQETKANGDYIFHVDRIGITVDYSDLKGNKYQISIHKK